MIPNRLLVLFAFMITLGCSTSRYTVDKEQHGNRKLRQAAAHIDTSSRTVEEDDYKYKPVATYPWVDTILAGENPGLELYRNPLTHAGVRDFFVQVAGSEEVALPILYHADRMDVPLFLAFSLVAIESRFRIDAVNQNPTSIDRGLFQLNDRSFPNLSLADFFHPDTNAYHGISYMRYTLDAMGDVERGLAMYNAGRTRVVRNEIPASTIVYVQRVLSFHNQLIDDFRQYILETFPPTV